MKNIRFRIPHSRIVGSTKQALAVQAAIRDAFTHHADGIIKRADNDMHGVTRVVCSAEEFANFIIARTKRGAQNMVAELYAQECVKAPSSESPDHVVTPYAFANGYSALVSRDAQAAEASARLYAGLDCGFSAPKMVVIEIARRDSETFKKAMDAKAEAVADFIGGGKETADAFKRGYAMYGDMNFWPKQRIYEADMAAYLRQSAAAIDTGDIDKEEMREHLLGNVEREELQSWVAVLIKKGEIDVPTVKDIHKQFGIERLSDLPRHLVALYRTKVLLAVAQNKEVDSATAPRGAIPDDIRDKTLEEIAGDFDRRAKRNQHNLDVMPDMLRARHAEGLKRAKSRNEYNAKLIRAMKGGHSVEQATRIQEATFFRNSGKEFRIKVRGLNHSGSFTRRARFSFDIPGHDPVVTTRSIFNDAKVEHFHWLDQRLDWSTARPAPRVRFAPDWNKPEEPKRGPMRPHYFDPRSWTGRYSK